VEDTLLILYYFNCTVRASNIAGPGVWYSIIGQGGLMEFLVFGDYDTQITIYSGNCESLECVNGNDESPTVENTASSSLTTFLESNETYSVLVHGWNGSVGNFMLKVSSVVTAPNDRCTGAIVLELGMMMDGSTVNAFGDDAEPCGE
jgi:hypothetical protein